MINATIWLSDRVDENTPNTQKMKKNMTMKKKKKYETHKWNSPKQHNHIYTVISGKTVRLTHTLHGVEIDV